MKLKHKKRVIGIGLDSATPEIIEPWVREGKLPVFKRLMETGCYGRLSSTVPALTPPAWTTSMTGVNPGKHNIYDFFSIQQDNKKRVVNSGDRSSKAIWNLLDDENRRSIIINLPVTYPAETFNGVMVTGMPTPTVKKGFVSPDTVLEEVLNLTDGKPLAVDIHLLLRGKESAFLEDLDRVTHSITRLTRHFMEKEDWDFLMVVFDDLDRIQHAFWHYIDKEHPYYDKEKAEAYQNAILKFYQCLEHQIVQLMESVNDDTLVLIFSDHGMGPIYHNFYINRFFEEQGWLKLKKKKIRPKEILRSIGVSQERVKLFIDAIGLRNIARNFLPASIKNYAKKYFPTEALELETFDWSEILDWEKSKAYLFSRTGQGILINKDNVEDYETFRDNVIESLLELRDPHTGQRVIEHIYKKESIFHGPCLDKAPDILIDPVQIYELQEKPEKEIFSDLKASRVPISANHYREGIVFICNSKSIRNNYQLSKVAIQDIAPTILYGLGMPIPQDMDGQVVVDAFDKTYLKNNPIIYKEIPLNLDGTSNDLSSLDTAKITDRLKGLGYID